MLRVEKKMRKTRLLNRIEPRAFSIPLYKTLWATYGKRVRNAVLFTRWTKTFAHAVTCPPPNDSCASVSFSLAFISSKDGRVQYFTFYIRYRTDCVSRRARAVVTRRSFHAASPRCSSHVAAAVSRDSASVAVVPRPVHLPPLVLWKIRQSRGDVVVPLCLHRVASPLIDTRVRN